MEQYADVILPVPFETFTYAVPQVWMGRVCKGSRVLVEFGKSKKYAGIVYRLHSDEPHGITIKPLLDVLDEEVLVTDLQFRFWRWVADYYISPLGDVYKAAFPSNLKKDNKPKTMRRRKTIVEKFADYRAEGITHQLNEAQQKAYHEILSSWTGPQAKEITLLHGVTSSGKTEIYIHLIQQYISEGKQVLYLLPEIALTTQMTDRLRRVFGNKLGVYHSKFSEAERVDVYKHQLSEHPYDVLLGVRSSVFLPFQRLGLVIVDEEHETSYKQQEPAPRYHARNAAMVLARMYGAKTLLGTATPSIETYYRAQSGLYGYVLLTRRYSDLSLPEWEVVDIARLRFQKRMKGAFSQCLLDEIDQALKRKEQVILFQNRRGFSQFVSCARCGWVPRCQHCDVSLTYHKRTNTLVCHYCGSVYQMPQQCPSCHSMDGKMDDANKQSARFVSIGVGTEKVEEQIARYFPEARLVRMDLDTAQSRTSYERIIEGFAAHEYDILIGTQMVSKGLDFDNVSVVGVLDADTMLNIPDFRSFERTFHVLSQVAGRAGRKGRRGKVVLQTRSADLPLIEKVIHNDYVGMYTDQLDERRLFSYPPFTRLIYVFLRHRDNAVLEHVAQDMAIVLRRSFSDRVLGPDRPQVSRVQSLFIRKIVLKLNPQLSVAAVRQILHAAMNYVQSLPYAAGVNVFYDVDPM